eukprot:tig00021795_g23531.t1
MEGHIKTFLIWSDLVIAISYAWIPVMLALFLRKRWIDFHLRTRSIIALFVAFIMACGSTHLVSVFIMTHGQTADIMRLSAALKFITAVVSAATAALMFWVMPAVLHIPIELEREKLHRAELEREITSRRAAEGALQKQVKHAAVLRHITDGVRSSLDASRIFDVAATEIGRAFGADMCAIWVCGGAAGVDPEAGGTPAPTPPSSAAALGAAPARAPGPPLRCVAVFNGTVTRPGTPSDGPSAARRSYTARPSISAAANRLAAGLRVEAAGPPGGIGLSEGGFRRVGALRGYAPLASGEEEAGAGPAPLNAGAAGEVEGAGGRRGAGRVPLIRRALASDAILQVPDVRQDPDHACYAFFEEMRAGSAFVVRTSFAGEANGVIFLARRGPSPRLAGDEAELLAAVAKQVGIASSRERRVNAALERARAAAEETNSAKSRFIASMSHEIRTPLNAVIGFTSVLLQYGESGSAAYRLSPEQADMLETIRSSGETLLTVINDILDFSKLEARRVEFEERAFSLPTIIEECLEIIATEAGRKGLSLAWAVEEEVPALVVGDPTRLKQILLNLLSNAAKFTAKGGITLRCELAPEPQGGGGGEEPEGPHVATPPPLLGAPLGPDDLQLLFHVTDSGIGVSPEGMERLFIPFSQVDASITRQFGGTGLGLAISRKLCEGMRGRIWATSRAGEGTTFSFYIVVQRAPAPLSRPHPSSRRASLAPVAPAGTSPSSSRAPSGELSGASSRGTSEGGEGDEEAARGRRVAVASACAVERRFFEVELGRAGAACFAAASLEEALAAAAGPVDLVPPGLPRPSKSAAGPAALSRPLRRAALFRAIKRALLAPEPGAGMPRSQRSHSAPNALDPALALARPGPGSLEHSPPPPAPSRGSFDREEAARVGQGGRGAPWRGRAPPRAPPPRHRRPPDVGDAAAAAVPRPAPLPLHDHLRPQPVLPAPPPPPAAAAPVLELEPAEGGEEGEEEGAGPPPRILVAEDNLVNQKVVSRLLAVVHGLQTLPGLVCVPNGLEAVRAVSGAGRGAST